MNKLVIILTFLLILPAQTLAGNSQDSATAASECANLAKACTGAARELIAARNLIAGYQQQIAASDERMELAKKEIQTLRDADALQSQRAKELENVIAAEKEAMALTLKKIDLQHQRIVSLEKQLGRARKFGLITGVAAAVAILIVVAQ
jgi:chromosome segregation ATPase